MIAPWLDPFRDRHGLAPVRGILRDWWHSPTRVLGMFPDWFSPPQPDWPPQVRLTGFPLYSEEGVSTPRPDVAAWIESDSPPIVFTPGSANVFGHGFFTAAVEACEILGRRGLLLSRFPEQIPAVLPDHVRHVEFVPFRWLLPRAAALVHHGGIGSASQVLAAGIPQVIMPLGFDQFDNLARVERLGVGTGLVPRRFRGPALACRLEDLLGDSAVAAACAMLAGKIAAEDGIGLRRRRGLPAAAGAVSGRPSGQRSWRVCPPKVRLVASTGHPGPEDGMSTISFYEARTHFSQLLDQVALGKRILITRHGRPAAVLGPPPDETARDVKAVIAEMKALRRGNTLAKKTTIRSLIGEGRRR